MAIKRIPCGGFFYDDESIEFDGDVMKVVGGDSDSGVVANAVISVTEGEEAQIIYNVVSVDKSVEELVDAVRTGKNAVIDIELMTDNDSYNFAVPVAVGVYGEAIITVAEITLPLLLLDVDSGGSIYLFGAPDEESVGWGVVKK